VAFRPNEEPLNENALTAIYAHAERAYPEECCGLVLSDGTVRPCAKDGARRVLDRRERSERPLARAEAQAAAKELDVAAAAVAVSDGIGGAVFVFVDAGGSLSRISSQQAKFDGTLP